MLTLQQQTQDILPVNEVIENAKKRSDLRKNGDFASTSAKDINLSYDNLTERYWSKINGEDFVFSDSAVSTACKLIGTNQTYLKGFADPQEFIRQFNKRIDEGKGSDKYGIKMKIRSHSQEKFKVIDAILPPNYKIMDDYDLLHPIVDMLESCKRNVRGISVRNKGNLNTYRIIYGDPLLTEKELEHPKNAIDVVLQIHNNELGCDCGLANGNFTRICSNVVSSGSWRGIGRSTLPSTLNHDISWNHLSAIGNFTTKVKKFISDSEDYGSLIVEKIQHSMQTPLGHDPVALVSHFSKAKFIPKEATKALALQMTSENVQTEWDWINVNTFVAQSFPFSVCKDIESASHVLLVNGIDTVLKHLSSIAH